MVTRTQRRIATLALPRFSAKARLGKLLSHGENTIFAVHGEPWVIRVHRGDYHPTRTIHGEVLLVEALSEAGFTVCTPIRTLRAEPLTLVEGVRVTVLTRLAGRRFRQIGKRRARILGETLAALHRFARNWKPPTEFHRPTWDLEALIGPEAAWGSMESAGFDPHLAEELRDALRQVLVFDEPTIPVHHDLHGGNILWDGDRPGIIDWDDAALGYPVFDVAIPALRLAPARREELFAGYGQTWPDPYLRAAYLALDARVLGFLKKRADVPHFDVYLKRALERVEKRARTYLATG